LGVEFYTGSFLVIEDDPLDRRVHNDVQVGVFATLNLGVEVAVCGTLACPVRSNVALSALEANIIVESSQIVELSSPDLLCRLDPVVLRPVGTVGAPADIDRAVGAMSLFAAWSMIGFEL